MLKIGLTGGIGSGKTTIAGIFEVLGIPVYYADEAARRLMNRDPLIKSQIRLHFGESAYKEGELDRDYIASLVFNNKAKLDLLNSLTHPATIKDADDWMEKQHGAYAIKEAALIFESGTDKMLDYVIGVDSPEELRLQRTMQRDAISREKVMARMKNQISEIEKMERCDFVVHNDEIQPVIPQVIKIHEKLLELAGFPGKESKPK